jgi:hypothetical protein
MEGDSYLYGDEGVSDKSSWRKKPFLKERLATREANEKMVLKPLAYSSGTP